MAAHINILNAEDQMVRDDNLGTSRGGTFSNTFHSEQGRGIEVRRLGAD